MKEQEIPISEQHGINPSIMVCPICGKDYSIALLGKLENDEEAPKRMLGNDVCDACKEKNPGQAYIVEIADNYLTGKYALVNKENIKEEYRDKTLFYVTTEEFNALTSHESETE